MTHVRQPPQKDELVCMIGGRRGRRLDRTWPHIVTFSPFAMRSCTFGEAKRYLREQQQVRFQYRNPA